MMNISKRFKKSFAFVLAFVLVLQGLPAVYGAEYSWKVLNISGGDNGFGCVSVCGASSVNETDGTVKYTNVIFHL